MKQKAKQHRMLDSYAVGYLVIAVVVSALCTWIISLLTENRWAIGLVFLIAVLVVIGYGGANRKWSELRRNRSSH